MHIVASVSEANQSAIVLFSSIGSDVTLYTSAMSNKEGASTRPSWSQKHTKVVTKRYLMLQPTCYCRPHMLKETACFTVKPPTVKNLSIHRNSRLNPCKHAALQYAICDAC